jgi:hypothetical protein
MTHFRRWVTTAAAMAALACALAAQAEEPKQKSCEELRIDLAPAAPSTAVTRLLAGGCLGDRRDPDPFAARATRLVDSAAKIEGKEPAKVQDVTLSADERRSLVAAMLRLADEYLGNLAAASPEDAKVIDGLRDTVQQAHRERNAGIVDTPHQKRTFWTWDGTQNQADQRPLGGTGIDIHGMFARAGCSAAPQGQACAATRATVEGLVRAARIAERAFSVDQAAAIQRARTDAAVRDARWRSYFADTRSQYPWEILFNSWIYDHSVRPSAGISGPPRWQLITLHPDVGMQYVKSAAAGDRFKPALILEIIGYNGWSWGNDNKAQDAWGASVVRTYADTASVPTGAWGISIHRNSKYTLSFSRLDGKTGVLFSIDLAGAVTKASEEWSDRLRFGR